MNWKKISKKVGFSSSQKPMKNTHSAGLRRSRTSNNYTTEAVDVSLSSTRRVLVLAGFLVAFLIAAGSAFYHQVYNPDFLRSEGEKRFEVSKTLMQNRGRIEDRNGVFLATSLPVRDVWIKPVELEKATPEQFKALSLNTGLSVKTIYDRMNDNEGKGFVYLKRQVPLANAEVLRAMKIPGVNFEVAFKRSYPQGPLTAHVVGFTNIENQGIEGVEKTFNQVLEGHPGRRVVMRDRLGRVIQDVEDLAPAQDGTNLQLTIDSQIQFLAFKAVEKAVNDHDADSGGAVVVDVRTGEILAMVSYPSYDPNNRFERKGSALRNRVITDTFEPGSIIKPLVAALALDSGAITTKTLFHTGSGSYQYQGHTITDVSHYNGTLDVAGILRRSSNIGMTMISERLRSDQMWTVFNALGFGHSPNIGFPGAATGRLMNWQRWRLINKATMAYGYGLSVSLLQVAQAYTALARDGDMISLSLIKQNTPPMSIQVYSKETARTIRSMLEDASGSTGTKIQGKVIGYRIGGKSGTARQIVNGQYSHSDYRGSFVAIAPMSNPRIVVAVTLDRPKKAGYYGSVVSGPVVAEIIEGTLKYISVPPDAALPEPTPTLEAKNNQNVTMRSNQG